MARINKPVVMKEQNYEPAPPKTLLQKAHEVIYGDREKTYGDPAKNLKVIAAYWSIHLSASLGIDVVLTTADVCNMMISLKQARLVNDPTSEDSMLDIAGYAGLMDRTTSR